MRVFTEQQRFTQTWFLAVLLVSLIGPIVIITNQFLKKNSSMDVTEFTVVISLLLITIIPIFFFTLKTRIDEIGVHYQFTPFHLSKKTILWNEIDKAYVRKYDAISEYGGWGLKGGWFWKKKNGVAYNVSGDIGVQLKLANGKKILIGTKKQQDIERTIATYFKKLETSNN